MRSWRIRRLFTVFAAQSDVTVQFLRPKGEDLTLLERVVAFACAELELLGVGDDDRGFALANGFRRGEPADGEVHRFGGGAEGGGHGGSADLDVRRCRAVANHQE